MKGIPNRQKKVVTPKKAYRKDKGTFQKSKKSFRTTKNRKRAS